MSNFSNDYLICKMTPFSNIKILQNFFIENFFDQIICSLIQIITRGFIKSISFTNRTKAIHNIQEIHAFKIGKYYFHSFFKKNFMLIQVFIFKSNINQTLIILNSLII